jgi:hypothetical protein
MSDYTPDWIHIYSGWWHFAPAAISAIFLFIISLLAKFRRRLFPRIPRWFPVLLLSLLIPTTLLLLVMAWSRDAWSIHAIDYGAKGWSPSAIRGEIRRLTDLALPAESAVDASVNMGWREYQHWFGIRGGSQSIRSQALELGYGESNGSDDLLEDPIPEPISQWLAKTKFQPDVFFRRNSGSVLNWIAVDTKRDLVFITGADY